MWTIETNEKERAEARWRVERELDGIIKLIKKKKKKNKEEKDRGRKLEKELKRHSASNHRADWLAGARDRPDPGQIN